MLAEQAEHILKVMLLGMVLGVVVDFYRVGIRLFRPRRTLLGVLDLAFWLSASLAVFIYLLRTTSGQARAYILGILLLGFLVEQKTIGGKLRHYALLLFRRLGSLGKRVLGGIVRGVGTALKVALWPGSFFLREALFPMFCSLRALVAHAKNLWPRAEKKDS